LLVSNSGNSLSCPITYPVPTSMRIELNFPSHNEMPTTVAALCSQFSVRHEPIIKQNSHRGSTHSFSHQNCRYLSTVVGTMTFILSTNRHVTMHVRLNTRTILEITGSRRDHMRHHINNFENRWGVRLSIDRETEFVTFTGCDTAVSACLLHVLHILSR
jgi:hypothetical protein